MINRHIEKIIEDVASHFPVVLLTGPRQIGKYTILNNLFLPKGYSYVCLDDLIELAIARNDPKSFLELHPSPLIIDEAQKAPQLFLEIERIVNKSRLERGNLQSNGMYILSGSQRKKLLDESEESLSGRVGILDMSNLSLNEIFGLDNMPFEADLVLSSKRAKRYYLKDSDIYKYIVRGFFPVLYDDTKLNTQSFYSSYLTTYLEKDLRDIIDIADELKFLNFMKLLASNTGKELVYDNYAKQVGAATNTIKAWVAALTKTAIIYLVRPYNDDSIVKRVVRRPKVYFFDTGLAAYLCGIDSPETLEKSFLKGRFFETFIYNEIRKSYMNAGVMQNLYYYRDTDQNEVDLVLVRNGKISCVEIKAGKSFNASNTKGFRKLESSKLEKGKNSIICTSDNVYVLADGTLVLPVASI